MIRKGENRRLKLINVTFIYNNIIFVKIGLGCHVNVYCLSQYYHITNTSAN